jgi:hypothetical protein
LGRSSGAIWGTVKGDEDVSARGEIMMRLTDTALGDDNVAEELAKPELNGVNTKKLC